MEQSDDHLYDLARDLVESMGYALVDAEEVRRRSGRVLRFFIDHPKGIGIDDCERVSRELGYLLDEEAEFDDGYVLEVSSPGLDRELRRPREFEHFAGRAARFVLREPHEGRTVFEGRILEAGPGEFGLELHGGGRIIVPLRAIARARLLIEDESVAGDGPTNEKTEETQGDG